jgi:hypothetical protein
MSVGNEEGHLKKEYPTYEHERDDLRNRLNRQLRRLRAIDAAERVFVRGKGRVVANKSYHYTTEMAYLLNDIQRGSVFAAPQVIRRGMDLVSELESYVTKLETGEGKGS